MVNGDSYLISQRESSSWYNLFQSSWTLNKKSDKVIYMHALYLQLFSVNLLVELYSIIWIKRVDLYFFKKKSKQEFRLLLSVLQVFIY